MKTWFTVVFLLAAFLLLPADEPLGIFANYNTNSIQLINPLTQEVSPSFLKGDLGTDYGILKDVVVTADGRTAIVSNASERALFFIDISGGFTGMPSLLTQLELPITPLKLALTPNGRFLLAGGFLKRMRVDASDRVSGSFTPNFGVFLPEAWCLAIDMTTRSVVCYNRLDSSATAMAVAPDGKTVFMADYPGMTVLAYTLGDDGSLTLRQTRNTSPNRPKDLLLSPDGRTLLAVDPDRYTTPVFAIDLNGDISAQSTVALPSRGGQGCVFSGDGSKAYYLSIPTMAIFGDANPAVPVGISAYYGTQIHELAISGPGDVSWSGITIPLTMSPREKIYDFADIAYPNTIMAISPSGAHLYITNPSDAFSRPSGEKPALALDIRDPGLVEIAVIDLAASREIAPLVANGIPGGIAFTIVTGE
jgi:hypothetical protein